MKDRKFILFLIILIFLVVLLLYSKPLLSGKALGLDSFSHLSKANYVRTFGLTNWDYVWYNGGPLLQFYSPGFHIILSMFDNLFLFDNILCVLSIFLTALGIFFLVFFYTKDYFSSLFSSLVFLSVLATSYYYLVVGNHPFLFSVFTIPFTLLFYELSKKNRTGLIFFYLFFSTAFLTHIFVGLCLMGIIGLRIIMSYRKLDIIKELAKYILLPILLCAFWLFPFFTKSSSFFGEEIFIPSLMQIIGLQNKMFFGLGGASMGIAFLAFIFCLFLVKKFYSDKIWFYLFGCSIILFLLFMGILGRFYPTGIGSIRFILPFTIIMCVFIGVSLSKLNTHNVLRVILFILVIIALVINSGIIKQNYEKYSHNSEDERFGRIYESFFSENFPISRENYSQTYRFGVREPDFAKSINLAFPKLSQTSGYYDQGIINEKELFRMFEAIWIKEDINETILYLDSFAIEYFEVGEEYSSVYEKFDSSPYFKRVYEKNSSLDNFRIYQYKDPKPIISMLNSNESLNKEAKIIRANPDRIEIYFNFSGNEMITFKESFYPSWKAIQYPDNTLIKPEKDEFGFMIFRPTPNTNKLIIVNQRTNSAKVAIWISILSLICLLFTIRNFKTSENT